MAQKRAQSFDEEVRVIAPRQQTDAPRVVDVLIEDALHPGILQFPGKVLRVVGIAERKQLHKQTAVQRLLHAAAHPALFTDIEWFHHYSVRQRLRSSQAAAS